MSKRHSEQFKQEAVAYVLPNKDPPPVEFERLHHQSLEESCVH